MVTLSEISIIVSTLAIMSIVYKENFVHRIAEHTMVGFAGAHAMLMAIQYLDKNVVTKLVVENQYFFLIPILFGFFMLSRVIKELKWLSRWAVGIIVGISVGIGIRGVATTEILGNIKNTMLPLNNLGNITQVICVITVIYFFIMTRHEKTTKLLNPISTLGRNLLMLGIGANFGNILMGRISLLTGRWVEILQILGIVASR